MSDDGVGAGLVIGGMFGIMIGVVIAIGGSVEARQWQEAEKLCASSGGVNAVKDTVDNNVVIVWCRDGTKVERYISG